MSRRASSGSEAEPESPAGIEISQQYVVKTKSSAKPWLPETVEKGGTTFVRLQKFDRGFIYFCLEKGMDTSKNGKTTNANTQGFNDLLVARKEASLKLAQDALEMPDNTGEEHRPSKKSKRKRVTQADQQLVNPIVQIQLPVLDHDGKVWEDRPAKCLWGLTCSDLWIEFTTENLAYMKALIQSGQPDLKPRKRASPKKKQRSPKKSPRLRRMRHLLSPAKDGESKEAYADTFLYADTQPDS